MRSGRLQRWKNASALGAWTIGGEARCNDKVQRRSGHSLLEVLTNENTERCFRPSCRYLGYESQRSNVSIPSWIHVNTVVAYDFSSAALLNGGPVSGQSITGVQQATVTSASASVAGSVQLTFNGIARSAQFSCSASGACTGYQANFWVDPTDPTHPFPNGQLFSVIPGTAPFTVPGRTWNAVTMARAYSFRWSSMLTPDSFSTIRNIILRKKSFCCCAV
jgi:hypothetical protein